MTAIIYVVAEISDLVQIYPIAFAGGMNRPRMTRIKSGFKIRVNPWLVLTAVPVISDSYSHIFRRLDSQRGRHLSRASKALAAMGCDIITGGGPGLMQAANNHTPLIPVGKLWPGLVEWVRSSVLSFETPLINDEDADIPICVANADEAVAIIRRHRQICGFPESFPVTRGS